MVARTGRSVHTTYCFTILRLAVVLVITVLAISLGIGVALAESQHELYFPVVLAGTERFPTPRAVQKSTVSPTMIPTTTDPPSETPTRQTSSTATTTASPQPSLTPPPTQVGLPSFFPPQAVLEIDGVSQRSGMGSVAWNGAAEDAVYLGTPQEPLIVSEHDVRARVKFDQQSPPWDVHYDYRSVDPRRDERVAITSYGWRWWDLAWARRSNWGPLNPEREVDFDMRLDQGLYVVTVEAHWSGPGENGDAEYGFLVAKVRSQSVIDTLEFWSAFTWLDRAKVAVIHESSPPELERGTRRCPAAAFAGS